MKSKILSLYRQLVEINSFDNMPSSWRLVNPYQNYWARFEFFINKYYCDNHSCNLIIALNPGRYGCNKTGIALTDENVLATKLNYPGSIPTVMKERTATAIYNIIDELHPDLHTFFSVFYMTNVFPFGVVKNGKNVEFKDIIRIPSIQMFCRQFIYNTIEIFRPEKIICIGRGSEKFMNNHFPSSNPVYLHHPSRGLPEQAKEDYCLHLRIN